LLAAIYAQYTTRSIEIMTRDTRRHRNARYTLILTLTNHTTNSEELQKSHHGVKVETQLNTTSHLLEAIVMWTNLGGSIY